MLAKDYRPVYDSSVYEYELDANGASVPGAYYPINQAYCLMLPSALMLATLFAATTVGQPAVALKPPIAQAPGSPYTFNHLVPWFQFTVGGQTIWRNAAVLASYWGMAGVNYADALNYAVLDVQTPVEGL